MAFAASWRFLLSHDLIYNFLKSSITLVVNFSCFLQSQFNKLVKCSELAILHSGVQRALELLFEEAMQTLVSTSILAQNRLDERDFSLLFSFIFPIFP
jgi:hypothetical protein